MHESLVKHSKAERATPRTLQSFYSSPKKQDFSPKKDLEISSAKPLTARNSKY
jgi:hypothetical protein